MYEMLHTNYPTETEGWSTINHCHIPTQNKDNIFEIEI